MIAAVPGITGLIDRLEAMGHVNRERSTEDRRVASRRSPPEGLDLRASRRARGRLHKTLVGHLTHDRAAELVRLLEKARQRRSATTAGR